MPLRKISSALQAGAVCLALATPAFASGNHGAGRDSAASGNHGAAAPAKYAAAAPAKYAPAKGHRIGTALCIVKVRGRISRCPHFRG